MHTATRNALDQSNIDNYFRVCDLLGCRRNGMSIAQAAEQIASGRRRASHRARRVARKVLTGDAPWPAINRASGYLRPDRLVRP
jgi:hypothetical protein